MAYSDNISRLSRLTAILLKLQARTYISVEELADQFGISKRTIYRDLKALEQAGVPIVQTEGKGFGIIDGYRLPPVSFTEPEANALIFGEKLIAKTKDKSLIDAYQKASDKIKSVLKSNTKEKAEFLGRRTIIGKNWQDERTSNYLSEIQQALTNYEVLRIRYVKEGESEPREREIEPFAIYHNTSDNWVLIAFCRLREDFRSFRIDRMQSVVNTRINFPPHKISLEEYVEIQRKRNFNEAAT